MGLGVLPGRMIQVSLLPSSSLKQADTLNDAKESMELAQALLRRGPDIPYHSIPDPAFPISVPAWSAPRFSAYSG